MLSRCIFWGAVAAGGLAFLAMLTVTVAWMTVPERIVYRESSPVKSEVSSVEVREHGQSYYLTVEQKQALDRVRSSTPIVWFVGFAVAFLSIVAGAAALLKMKDPPQFG
jgi:hypothetical protein